MWKWIVVMCVIFVCSVSLASSDKSSKVNVSGVWHGYYYNGDEGSAEMTLKQKGKNITGSMEVISTYRSNYSISGEIDGYTITSFKIIPMDDSVETKEYTGTVDKNQSVMDLTNVDDSSDTARFIKEYECDKITEK